MYCWEFIPIVTLAFCTGIIFHVSYIIFICVSFCERLFYVRKLELFKERMYMHTCTCICTCMSRLYIIKGLTILLLEGKVMLFHHGASI